MTIRLLASDLDGTFLGHDGTVSPRNLQALRDARAAGLDVMFVTGRPPRWLPNVIAQTGFDGLIVSANGGIVVDAGTREVVRTYPIATELAIEAVDRLMAVIPGCEFGVERSTVGMRLAETGDINPYVGVEYSPNQEFAMTAGYKPHGATAGNVPIGDVHDLVQGDRAVKMVLRPTVGTWDVDALLAVVHEQVDGLLQATHSSVLDVLIEFSAVGVTKGSTLAQVATERGYTPDEVAAVGDMPNDVPMLQWVGNPFVMRNAHPSLFEQFTTVIGSHDEDAVGQLLMDLAGAL